MVLRCRPVTEETRDYHRGRPSVNGRRERDDLDQTYPYGNASDNVDVKGQRVEGRSRGGRMFDQRLE